MTAQRRTDATEDYLKAIYDLSSLHGRATTNHLADRLNVTPASVTGMIKRLASAKPPLLVYRKHHGVELTAEGERAALEVIRHHRLIELFLQKTLGYSWDEVHAEADRLEHVISAEFVERIARALGDPLRDPHGEPIPTRDLKLPPSSDTRLSDMRVGEVAVVERVEALDHALLRHLAELGLLPGVRIKAVAYSVFDGNLSLQVASKPDTVVLGPLVTRQVYISRKVKGE